MAIRRKSGQFLATSTSGERVNAYLPNPLPPVPPVELIPLLPILDKVNLAIGRLDALTRFLPAPDLFLYMYVRKEALLSSQIEGTQSSLSDLLLHEHSEAPGVPFDDVREVSRYVAAMYYGLERMRRGFPLSLRLIREIHGVLLRDGRGANQEPGEFRTTQNWIGGTRPGTAVYVPPPPERLMESLGAFENFLHDDSAGLPLMVKLGLVHAQFESIHPFLDGNGRIGRLLITLMLCECDVLHQPMLYLSLYFKQNRDVYYDLLQRVRRNGEWEEWLRFFLEGVEQTACEAVDKAVKIRDLFDADRNRIAKLGRVSLSVLRVHNFMQRRPLFTMMTAARELDLSPTTVSTVLGHLVKLGIVRETTGRGRDRIFSYAKLVDLISEGTEPLPR